MKRQALLGQYDKAKQAVRTAAIAFCKAQTIALETQTEADNSAANKTWQAYKNACRERARLGALLNFGRWTN